MRNQNRTQEDALFPKTKLGCSSSSSAGQIDFQHRCYSTQEAFGRKLFSPKVNGFLYL